LSFRSEAEESAVAVALAVAVAVALAAATPSHAIRVTANKPADLKPFLIKHLR
jgi:hypothetical protein